ncbi:MAG: WD40 repeat domain-containing protein, partial [Planctomycetaceae bacterium]|nr:WD40 repeat domain-containing protein [Planctomycetaceae bacterium]
SAQEPVVRMWDTSTGQPLQNYSGHTARPKIRISAVACSPDGATSASAEGDLNAEDKELHLWETGTGKQRWKINTGTHPTHAIKFSPDGKALAVLTSARLMLLSAVDGKEQWTFSPVDGPGLQFHPDGRRLLCGLPDGFAVLDSTTGQQLRKLAIESDRNLSCSLSHDGQWLATCLQHPASSQVSIMNFETGQEFANLTINGTDPAFRDARFFPKDNRLATARAPNAVEIWELQP